MSDALEPMLPTLSPYPMNAEELRDRVALQHLGFIYCHAIDRRDYSLLRSLYHDNAIDDHGSMYCGPVEGFIKWLPTALAAWRRTAHIIHNALYLIDGDSAQGQLNATVYHLSQDGTHELVIHGRYIDKYERRDGIWRFFHRSLALDWLEDRETDPTGIEGGDGVSVGCPGLDDPIYNRLGLFQQDRMAREAAIAGKD